ncbi:MAG: hypothetical protein J5669_00135 [Bacteroidales bacterium]|nr:hypothetical protein [Bacteroidales bacterium]
MKEDWAIRLKEKMTGFEQPVDSALWAGIAGSVAPAPVRWWPWAVAAVAAAAAVVGIVLLPREEPVLVPDISLAQEVLPSSPVQAPIVQVSAPGMTKNPVQKKEASALEKVLVVAEQEETADEETVEELPPVAPAQDPQPSIEESLEEDLWAEVLRAEESAPRRRVTVAASMYAQTSPFGNRHSTGASPVSEEPSPVSDKPAGAPHAGDIPSGDPSDGNPPAGDPSDDEPGDSEEGDDTKALGNPVQEPQASPVDPAEPEWTHAFPVQVGARISVLLSERWSVETGLTYMHFDSWNACTRQRMEYLGIPLYVNFIIGNARNFSFYASAGGQALKCFAGNAPDKPWLFSCGLGAGAEYHISPLISLYAQPGADWYFHTGESRNYYTDNPFAFSLSVGIRFHLK